MSTALERALGVIELLSQHGEGLDLSSLAAQLDIPPSATHRLLADLVRLGYVRQARGHGDYVLTTKLIAMGLSYLSKTGMVDVAQPLLNRLADASGELVRLSVVDGDRLTWVARAQGARQGLRYDPDMGSDAHLSCSSSGWAWLATLSDDEALALMAKQGVGLPANFGPNAPPNLQAALGAVQQTRELGYSLTTETYALGLSALSAPVRFAQQPAMGVLTIAGPSARLTPERMQSMAPELISTADQLAALSGASPFFSLSHQSVSTSAASLPELAGQGRKPIYAA